MKNAMTMSTIPRILATTALCLAALGLSSCVLETHQRVLDTAKEYDGIVVLHDAVYRVGSRYYVQGVQTTLRRSNRDLIGGPYAKALSSPSERSGVYSILPEAPRKTVYREFSLLYERKPFDVTSYAHYPMGYSNEPPGDDVPVWPREAGAKYEQAGWHPYYNKRGEVIAWCKYAIEDIHGRQYKGPWRHELPAGASPVLLSAEQIAGHPILSGESGVGIHLVWERSEGRVDKARALYAYPLAGVCWLVPDALVTGIINLPMLPVVLCMVIEESFK